MSKKSKKPESKKPAGKTNEPGLGDPQPWINELKTLIINDGNWRCNVQMLVETNSYNTMYITAANTVFNTGKNVRPFVKVITNASLACALLEMSYNMNISTVSFGYKKLCEEVIKFCSSEGFSDDIPTPVLASVIKYYIYYLKLKNLEELTIIDAYLKKKAKINEESLLAIQTIVKGSAVPSSAKGKDKTPAKSKPASSKKSGKEPVKEAAFTEIRKRGEEILDTLNIPTDKPENGPQLYIILNSFRQADLPSELLKLQVPLMAIVKLYDFCTPDEIHLISENANERIYNGLHLICKEHIVKQRRFSNIALEHSLNINLIDSFWNQFYKIISNNDNVLLFKDTIFLKFFPRLYKPIPPSKKINLVDYEDVQMSFYNQLCHLLYDIEDVRRQHENFVNHLIEKHIETKRLYDLKDMTLYTSAMEAVPPEIINIPFIFDCILVQATHLVNNKERKSITSDIKEQPDSISEKDGKPDDSTLVLKLQELDVKHDLFYQEDIPKEDENVLPLVLVHGDEVGIKNHWWDETERVKAITCHLLKCFWEQFLFWNLPIQDEISYIDVQDDDNLFYMLQNTGEITIRDKLCNLPCVFDETSFTVENRAYIFCLQSISDNDSLVLFDKGSDCEKYRCDDMKSTNLIHYESPLDAFYEGQIYDEHSLCFEDMTWDIMLQNLFSSFESFNCNDLVQNYFKSGLFIKFHHRKTCSKVQHLMGTLKTKMSLRDFYEYSIEEEFYWLNEQEFIFDKICTKNQNKSILAAINKLQYFKNRLNFIIERTCSERNFQMNSVLKDGEEAKAPELLVVPSYTEEQDNERNSIYEAEFFQAFDIDLPNRVQFSEKRQEFIISMNSCLQTKLLSRLYRDDALALQITIHNHTLYFYQQVGGEISSNLHLIHESGMMFYFNKNKINNSNLKSSKEHDIKISPKVDSHPAAVDTDVSENVEESDIFLKPLLYQLCFSLPNTLLFELINPSNVPLYVKQYYLDKISVSPELKDEEHRCYLTDGQLIKFMVDGSVIIYLPNSEVFICKTTEPATNTETIPETAKPVSRMSVKVKPSSTQKKSAAEKIMPPRLSTTKETVPAITDSYEHILATGKRFSVVEGTVTELEPLFSITETDLFNGIIVTKRSDGTVLTYNMNGTRYVDFPDGSRITTIVSIAPEEINFDEEEALDEAITHFSYQGFTHSEDSDEISEISSDQYELHLNKPRKSEGFLLVNIQHYFEHVNFAPVLVDLSMEVITVNLPFNVDVSISSEGLYNINFDEKAEFITEYDELIFREKNDNHLPAFTIHLSNIREAEKQDTVVNYVNQDTISDSKEDKRKGSVKNKTPSIKKEGGNLNTQKQETIALNDLASNEKTNNLKQANVEHELTHKILSCKDEFGNILTIDSNGNNEIELCEGYDNICKCDSINNCRQFIFSTDYNGIEVLPPEVLESYETEAKTLKHCVVQNYGSEDHQAMLIMKPLTWNEHERWLMHPKELKYFPTFIWPSTYNDETTSYLPFPKKKLKSQPKPKPIPPKVLLIRAINRVNCNMHLMGKTFEDNRKIINLLRLSKNPNLALELYERGDKPFLKADKVVIEYIRKVIISSLIARVRSRVVKRLEVRLTKEYTNILVHRLLLPYFDSAKGAVFIILSDLLLMTAQLCSSDVHRLEKLFYKPLKNLSDEDLDYMHDCIAPLTVSRFCNCDEDRDFCKLRILLLAGRTLCDIFPDMISVFYSYGGTLKKKKEAEGIRITKKMLKKLMFNTSGGYTEEDITFMHDELRKQENITFCTCSENKGKCKLRAMLLACVILNFIFEDVNSLFKALNITVDLEI